MLCPETERLWHFLKNQPALKGFILIGGSALALRIQHRSSEDLDFAFPEIELPRARLEALLHIAASAEVPFKREDDESALQDFVQAGLELHDFQQTFIAAGVVKVSFFVPDSALAKVLRQSHEPMARLATLSELFKSKCLVSALRSKTRDWVDLYLLMKEHGFTIHDFSAAFREAGVDSQRDIALSRLCSGVPQKDDEGYAHLLPNPPALEQIRDFFVAQRNRLEIDTAAEAFRKQRVTE